MAGGSVIRDIDRGWKKIIKQIQEAKGLSVTVGVQGAKAEREHKDPDGGDNRITMVRLAGVHEFGATIAHPGGTAYFVQADGTAKFVSNKNAERFGRIFNLKRTAPHAITIPERSFIRATVDKKRSEIAEMIQKLVGKLLDGGKPRDLLGLLGLKVKSDMQASMENGLSPDLSPSTIAQRRNGGTKPLIDTGALRNAIDFKIRKEGDE
jgi:hypothetical protein